LKYIGKFYRRDRHGMHMSNDLKPRKRRVRKRKGILVAKHGLLTFMRPASITRDDRTRRHRIKKKRGQPRVPRTRSVFGFIYFIQAGPFVKIGWSGHSATRRIREMQPGCPYKIEVLGMCRVRLTMDDERALHDRFRAHHFRGEWFHLSDEIKTFVDEHCRSEKTAIGEASIYDELHPK
jgi:hypothetical protein